MPEALTKDDQPVYASQYTNAEWDALKTQSLDDPLAFKMPCCASRAVLKTSMNGVQFFAHYSEECATAPETIWHVEAKDLVFGALKLFGLAPRSEVAGGAGKDRWKADVYVEIGERRIAIELQRSYQHLRDFVRRQERYARWGVECYWLVRHDVGRTLGKAIMTKRWKEEYDRKNPPHGHMFNTWPAFYFGMLMPERDPNVITPGLQLSHFELLAHIYQNELHWNGVQWAVKRDD
ncbi:Competence protein CoiA-like family protein [Pseudomonas syringae]|uniref:competence protein CoiA n=1 Tax=Pseudomonas syringae TaxID=317 RepID=UPI000894B39D|nr:competence protein CoiA family protein [Pseudomonas syringae]SDW00138.1 Competence protein CoiA-like family protein [Pseudomonas syringae]SFL34497.1 Competence protein CoiA-like family protein [Pseudomonas syringae]